MVQNHMLQLLCLVAMEPPTSLEPDAVRDEKLKVLRALRPIDAQNAANLSVRGQYRAGAAGGSAVPGYANEVGRAGTLTETFVALKAEVRNWRWAGVPFYLRTGKRLTERVSEIVVTFRAIPHSIFDGTSGPIVPNKLVLRLQPDEGVKLWLMNKVPGPGGLRLRQVPLDMTFESAFGGRQPEAYERLLMDVVRGNPTLFMRRDEVEAAWQWVDPILAAWAASEESPKSYTAGYLGAERRGGADRTRRPHLARGRRVSLDRRMATSAFVEHRFADRESVADALALAVAEDLRGAIAARATATLAVSGGTTPALFFRRLALQALDWAGVVVTLCDERWVPPGHDRSNARLVRENLLRGAAEAARFVPLYTDAPDPESGLAEVGARIDALPMPFDVVTLGLGLDGHTASWFPGGDHLAAALDPNGTAKVLPMRAPDAGEPRITLTLPVLAVARRSYLHFEGSDKLTVFERVIRGDGAFAASPLRAMLRNSTTPLEVYWSE